MRQHGHYNGKKKFVPNNKDFLFESYFNIGKLPPLPPGDFGHETLIPVETWGELGNDKRGDCVEAAGCHAVMVLTAEGTRTPAPFTTAQAFAVYTALTGFDPVTGANDNGTAIRDFLEYWRTKGLPDANGVLHYIKAYGLINNRTQLQYCKYLLGGAILGFELPQSALDQFNSEQIWTVVPGSPVVGGHCIPDFARRSGNNRGVTWGEPQSYTDSFYDTYSDEAWWILTDELIDKLTQESPEGFTYEQLQADLDAIEGITGPVADQVTVTVTDAAGATASETFDLTIDAAPVVPLEITTTDLPAQNQGELFEMQLEATGGTAPYFWSITGLPAKVTVNAAGVIEGIPTVDGTFTLAITVTDSGSSPAQTATITIPWTINSPALELEPIEAPNGVVGEPYSYAVQVDGGDPPYVYSIENLPVGLSIDPKTGVISGIPTEPTGKRVMVCLRLQ